MNIIIEGADGTGKSTLASTLSRALGMPVVPRTPKPANDLELIEKIHRHLDIDNAIHDRHPVITELIYARVLRGIDRSTDTFWTMAMKTLVQQRPLVILTRLRFYEDHRIKPGESAEHIREVHDNYSRLRFEYDQWGISNAHILYQFSDDLERLISMVRGVINERIV